jgi:hypothetical protein
MIVAMIDMTGQRYGRYTVMEYAGHSNSNGQAVWVCKCSCGTIKEVVGTELRRGKCLSCGCLAEERLIKAVTTHNKCNTRIYRIYAGILQRCNNSKSDRYKNYGGRGIKVCDEWSGKDGFINFYNWSMANGYSDELSIDRIDNDGNYEPSNCRWADAKTQSNNKRWNRNITIDGVTHNITQWSEISGVSRRTIMSRIDKMGWDAKEAIFTPVHKTRKAFNRSGYRNIEIIKGKTITRYTVFFTKNKIKTTKTFYTLEEALKYRDENVEVIPN